MKEKHTQKGAKVNKNGLEVLSFKQDKETPPKLNLFNREIGYLKVKDVKRAYSRLIQDYCRGLVTNEDAKTVVYMFSGYLQLVRDVEFEERLKLLESKTNVN